MVNTGELQVDRGEFVAVMGPSGSGKSTCMNILGCLDTPTSGHYWFNGVDVGSLTRNQRALLRRHYLGFIFQGYNYFLPLPHQHGSLRPRRRGLCTGDSSPRVWSKYALTRLAFSRRRLLTRSSLSCWAAV